MPKTILSSLRAAVRTTMTKAAPIAGLSAMALLGAACGEETVEPDTSKEFVLTIENIGQAFDYLDGDVFNTPVGLDQPGPALPGAAYEFRFKAAPGQKLSFVSMFAQSNDWFYAPLPGGLDLFASDGTARTGDVTSDIYLWDAGTEADEEVGKGPNQAPRQAGANTGDADPDTSVRQINNPNPAVDAVISATLNYQGDGWFTLRLANVSQQDTLMVDGAPVPAPFTPGVYAVHGDQGGLFKSGDAAPTGLESLAEDGSPVALHEQVSPKIGLTTPFAPGVVAVHDSSAELFNTSSPASAGLEALAEDGNAATLATALESVAGINEVKVFNTPGGEANPGPLFPGQKYQVSFKATPGAKLSFATMLVQSNDVFAAPNSSGIELFDAQGAAKTGDITAETILWDAGTEVDQAPGAGKDQAPRQSGPDVGEDQGANVRRIEASDNLPELSKLIKVSLSAN